MGPGEYQHPPALGGMGRHPPPVFLVVGFEQDLRCPEVVGAPLGEIGGGPLPSRGERLRPGYLPAGVGVGLGQGGQGGVGGWIGGGYRAQGVGGIAFVKGLDGGQGDLTGGDGPRLVQA